jgi:hypothetical protein
MLRTGRWLLAAAWLAASGALASPSPGQPPSPPPRTEEELAAARRLFADALRDEEARRFEVALDAFRRVRDVRDTAPVEYRIGTCLEGLGRLTEAMSAYDGAVRLGEGDIAQADLVAGSRERADVLSKRVAHLSLTPSSHAPPDAEMRVDGTRRPAGDVVLDPGSHRVEATASGAPPFQSDITLPEGGRLSLTVPLDPAPVSSTLPPQAGEQRAPVETGTTASSTSTWGWIAIGAGTVLVAGSITSFVLRESDIRTANRLCAGGGCEGSIDGDALSATNRARVEGPLGVALCAAGVVAAGLGVYLVVRTPPGTPAMSLAPTTWRGGMGLELRGAL